MNNNILLTLLCCFFLLATITTTSAAFLTTTISGNLIFEALEGHGAPSTQKFGLGTPGTGNQTLIFTIYLADEELGTVNPSSIVNMGYYPAESNLEFYNHSNYDGDHWAFSSRLNTSDQTDADITVFTDPNNRLSMDGSVVKQIGTDDWILFLDDAASALYGMGADDNNEMIIRVRVDPVAPVPIPSAALLLGSGLGRLALYIRRKQRNKA